VLSVSAAANNTLNSPPSRLLAMIQARVDMKTIRGKMRDYTLLQDSEFS
jgi:hypothetical protein